MGARWQQPIRQVPWTNRNCLLWLMFITPYTHLNWDKTESIWYSNQNQAGALNKQKLFVWFMFITSYQSYPHSVWIVFNRSSNTTTVFEIKQVFSVFSRTNINVCFALCWSRFLLLTFSLNKMASVTLRFTEFSLYGSSLPLLQITILEGPSERCVVT